MLLLIITYNIYVNKMEYSNCLIKQGSVCFMNERPLIGQLEYIIRHNYTTHISPNDILEIITPYVLERLGGQTEDWIISTKRDNEYYFEWKNIDNKVRASPLHRTRAFIPYRDTINITYV